MLAYFSRLAGALGLGQASRTDRLVYAVGDLHGRLDLLQKMIAVIEADAIKLGQRPLIIFMGDYVDRGPASALVLDEIIALGTRAWCDLECLMGNHEYAMLRFFHDPMSGPFWLRHGGDATLKSYGLQAPLGQPDADALLTIRQDLRDRIPSRHFRFLVNLKLSYQVGDYFFAHAGVKPGVALKEQTARDLLWIRQPFLATAKAGDRVIVHGHTIQTKVVNKRWRIGVDTGAYATGTLSAIRLNGSQRRVLQIR